MLQYVAVCCCVLSAQIFSMFSAVQKILESLLFSLLKEMDAKLIFGKFGQVRAVCA